MSQARYPWYQNPLWTHELRVFMRARRRLARKPWQQKMVLVGGGIAYLAILAGWWHESLTGHQDHSEFLVIYGALLLFGLVLAGTQGAAGGWATERQRATLDTLLTTPLRNGELIAGKLLSSLMGPVLVTALALPFLVPLTSLSKPEESLRTWLALLVYLPTVAFGLCGVGQLCSAAMRSAAMARAAAIGIALALTAVVPMFESMLMALSYRSGEPCVLFMTCPMAGFVVLGTETHGNELMFLFAALGPVFYVALGIGSLLLLRAKFDSWLRSEPSGHGA